ncbi:MAG: hypothetical protein AAGJ28_14400 [Pseudomonadota bacterium]
MSDEPAASDAALYSAVDTLITRLEREHAWAVELRTDLQHTEREMARLLSACDAAIRTIPLDDRGGLSFRLARIAIKDDTRGRPPKDGRYSAMLAFLADRPGQEISPAAIAAYLRAQGLRDTRKYIACALHRWSADGMVHRVGRGRYIVNGDDQRLRRLRLKPALGSHRAAVRGEMKDGREAAGTRFEEERKEELQANKSSRKPRMRRDDDDRPRPSMEEVRQRTLNARLWTELQRGR